MRFVLIFVLLASFMGCGNTKKAGSTAANSDEASGSGLLDDLLASNEQAKTIEAGLPKTPAANPQPNPVAPGNESNQFNATSPTGPPQTNAAQPTNPQSQEPPPQNPVAAKLQPGQNVLEIDKPLRNPYKITPPATPPVNRKPQLVHYQTLMQANPNVRIVQKPQAGHILTFAQNALGTIGLRKSIQFYRATNGTYPPFNDFVQMVQLNKTEFPNVQANQMYAYCSQSGAVFVVQK